MKNKLKNLLSKRVSIPLWFLLMLFACPVVGVKFINIEKIYNNGKEAKGFWWTLLAYLIVYSIIIAIVIIIYLIYKFLRYLFKGEKETDELKL